MKSAHLLVPALAVAALLGAASTADAALLQRQGKVTFLRVHDVAESVRFLRLSRAIAGAALPAPAGAAVR